MTDEHTSTNGIATNAPHRSFQVTSIPTSSAEAQARRRVQALQAQKQVRATSTGSTRSIVPAETDPASTARSAGHTLSKQLVRCKDST